MNLKADFFLWTTLAVDKFAWQFLSYKISFYPIFIVFFFLLIIRLYCIFNVFNISHDIAFIAVEM